MNKTTTIALVLLSFTHVNIHAQDGVRMPDPYEQLSNQEIATLKKQAISFFSTNTCGAWSSDPKPAPTGPGACTSACGAWRLHQRLRIPDSTPVSADPGSHTSACGVRSPHQRLQRVLSDGHPIVYQFQRPSQFSLTKAISARK